MIHKQYNTAMQGRVENTDNKNAQNAQKKETITMNLFEKILIVSIMASFTTALIIGSALIIFLILT